MGINTYFQKAFELNKEIQRGGGGKKQAGLTATFHFK